MNYKETLLFIGKCLTINHEKHNKDHIEKQLISKSVDWDNVVKVSTAQLVFPALYINLKRADFLHYLPDDLVAYMEHITKLNRERNKELIIQAKEINKLLLANDIIPIFLKGTAFLLQDLYTDVGERMVGDIDFLVSYHEIEKTAKIFKEKGYFIKDNKIPESYGRHYPRLIHENKLGAIEIHREILKPKHREQLNYNTIYPLSIKIKDEITIMEYSQALTYNILNHQVNDYGYSYKSFYLKTMYDSYLLSKKNNTINTIEQLTKHKDIINDNIALTSFVFNSKSTLKSLETPSSKKFIRDVFKDKKLRNKIISMYLPFERGIQIGKKIITNKKYFKFLTGKIFSLDWYKERFF